MIARQIGDAVNRFAVVGAVAVLTLYIVVVLASAPRGGAYGDPIELVFAVAALAVLVAQVWRVMRNRRKLQNTANTDETRRRLPDFLDHLPVQAAFLTPDMTYAFVNDAYSASLGRPTDEVVGKHLSQIVPPDLLEEISDNLEKALAGRQVTWHFDFSRPVLDRTQGAAVYQPLSDRGQVVGVLVMIMDRSAVQDAVHEAEVSAAKHALAAEVAGIGYLEWDQQGALVDASPEVEALLGRDAQNLREMWQQGQSFVEPRSRATIRNNLHMAGSRPRDVVENVKFLAASGRQIEARACIRRLDRGRHAHLLAAIQDVTDQQNVLTELVKSETRFRDFTESATDWVWEMDAEGRFTSFVRRGPSDRQRNPDFRSGQNPFRRQCGKGPRRLRPAETTLRRARSFSRSAIGPALGQGAGAADRHVGQTFLRRPSGTGRLSRHLFRHDRNRHRRDRAQKRAGGFGAGFREHLDHGGAFRQQRPSGLLQRGISRDLCRDGGRNHRKTLR
ncbi:PAS domain-containing protein [Sulfitobacter sp. 1A15299]|uniref:PAS domain-containing protein n=1 Tax=Sulfitobacter sp. 1A15299 TaxID=3368598 RepID=UPI0037485916